MVEPTFPAAVPPLTAADLASLGEQLDQLDARLAEHEFIPGEVLAALRERIPAAATGPFELLELCLMRYDYIRARQLVQELRQALPPQP